MRRESLFFGILTLVVSAFLTGCSDDDTEVYVPQRVAEFNLSDESDGNRLFIIHPWEGEIAIPVHDDRIRDFEFSGKYFDWEMRQGAESRFLVLNLKKEVEREAFPREGRPAGDRQQVVGGGDGHALPRVATQAGKLSVG